MVYGSLALYVSAVKHLLKNSASCFASVRTLIEGAEDGGAHRSKHTEKCQEFHLKYEGISHATDI